MTIVDDAEAAGVTVEELVRVRLADTFSAMLAGRLPPQLIDAMQAVGNGAGVGSDVVAAAWHDALYEDGRSVDGQLGEGQAAPTAEFAVASLREFMQIERPELRYYIPGLLPEQGKLLITAAAKVGKTFWAINLAICIAGGYCDWLGMQFGEPAKVLVLQPELSDGLMSARLKWVLQTAPCGLNMEDALDNLHIWQCDVMRPVLNNGGEKAVEEVIDEMRPEVIICDPLYAIFPGLVENAAEEMTLALDRLTSWTARFGCAVVLTHHHSKNGTSRGSSVLQGWPETDLSMSFVPDDHNEHVQVDGLFRCTFGDDWPRYWRVPNKESGWFCKPEPGWSPGDDSHAVGRPAAAPVSVVAEILRQAGGPGLAPRELVDAIRDVSGCGARTAQSRISQAKKEGSIGHANGVYYAV